MQDKDKTRAQLLRELIEVRQQLTALQTQLSACLATTIPARAPTVAATNSCQAEALQASETRYRRLFEAAQDGILILAADTGKIIDINPFLLNLLGYAHADLVGKALWEIGPVKNIEASRLAFAELQSQAYIRYEDLPLETYDGRRIDVEFVSNSYLVDDQNVIQCNIRDITARKYAEAQLQQYTDHLESLVA